MAVEYIRGNSKWDFLQGATVFFEILSSLVVSVADKAARHFIAVVITWICSTESRGIFT